MKLQIDLLRPLLAILSAAVQGLRSELPGNLPVEEIVLLLVVVARVGRNAAVYCTRAMSRTEKEAKLIATASSLLVSESESDVYVSLIVGMTQTFRFLNVRSFRQSNVSCGGDVLWTVTCSFLFPS